MKDGNSLFHSLFVCLIQDPASADMIPNRIHAVSASLRSALKCPAGKSERPLDVLRPRVPKHAKQCSSGALCSRAFISVGGLLPATETSRILIYSPLAEAGASPH